MTSRCSIRMTLCGIAQQLLDRSSIIAVPLLQDSEGFDIGTFGTCSRNAPSLQFDTVIIGSNGPHTCWSVLTSDQAWLCAGLYCNKIGSARKAVQDSELASCVPRRFVRADNRRRYAASVGTTRPTVQYDSRRPTALQYGLTPVPTKKKIGLAPTHDLAWAVATTHPYPA